jgi:hypothetical protein
MIWNIELGWPTGIEPATTGITILGSTNWATATIKKNLFTISNHTSSKTGTPGRTRTCYPRLRRPMLYPDELRALKSGSQYSRLKLVGVERFELPTSCSQSRRATRLRYTPNILQKRLLAKRRHDTHATRFRQYFTAFAFNINLSLCLSVCNSFAFAPHLRTSQQ